MTLHDLLKTTEALSIQGRTDLKIEALCYDSRQVRPGSLFFALRGALADGHRFVAAAVDAGAAAIVVEDPSVVPAGITAITVSDSRLAMSLMAAGFYGNPTGSIPVVGITGTNGKTTTTYIVEAILAAAGIPAAVLGTVNYRFRDHVLPAPNTTPESVELQRILRELVDAGARSAVMEVSSHALEQRRVDGCRFDVGIFTNLTRDHLDYHGDLASYRESKIRLFTDLLRPDREKGRRHAAINVDDPAGDTFAARAACPVITYGEKTGAVVTARGVKLGVDGIEGTLVTPAGETPFRSPLLGRFNLANVLAATAAGIALDIPLAAIREGIEGHRQVPGRLERVENERGITLLVDYAHTGDALDNVLRTLRDLQPARLISVFGCGGDRDRGKRPIMGEVAVTHSDFTIVTSDNPRSERPAAIIDDIRAGIVAVGVREYRPDELENVPGEKAFVAVEDRRQAIRLAARLARPGDIVLLAGKGHEDYQIVGGVRHHFDDREEGAAACRNLET